MSGKRILVLDNYDSFTYNLVHIIRQLGYASQMDIFRNDKIDLAAVAAYDKILLSPGPGIPSEAGIMPQLIKQYASSKSILGVCLGHQAIAEAFGGRIFNMPVVLHGVEDDVQLSDTKDAIFEGLPATFRACRYHSWSVEVDKPGEGIAITAMDNEGRVMALRHKAYDVRGVQFHPESILTKEGTTIIKNWLEL